MNPMHELLRQTLGIDAFALDGDEATVEEPWQERRPERTVE